MDIVNFPVSISSWPHWFLVDWSDGVIIASIRRRSSAAKKQARVR